MNSACPPAGELERLLADQLSAAEEQALETHLADCEACRGQLEELTRVAPVVQPVVASNSDSREVAPRRGGALARLARSSNPALRLAESNVTQYRPRPATLAHKRGESSAIVDSGRYLRRQVWTWPLIAAALLGGAGWWVNRSVESAMREQRINELTTVLEADVTAVRGWMDNQRINAETIAADEQLRPLVQALLALSDGTPQARRQLIQAPAQAAIRSRLEEPRRRGGFSGFVVTSSTGITLADDEDAAVGTALGGYRGEFFAGVIGDGAAVSKPFLNPRLQADSQGELRADQPCMYAAAPILEGGRPIAAIGLRIRPDAQFTQILKVARSGDTGETYAFDRRGVLLSESRFDEQLKQIGLLVDRPDSKSILNVELRDPGVNMVQGKRPTTRRADQPLTRMAAAAIQEKSGHDVDGYPDYRGVPVVGAWQWLDDYDFGVATEVDVDEAFAPVYILRRAFRVLMGLLAAAALGIFLAMLFIARQQRELHTATLAAQQLGQYTLVEKLGAGGMGTVYKARHALLRRPTAVKLLNPAIISDAAIARFEREVQLTSGLSHPNTVAVYDYGRTPEGDFYYVMEFLEGSNLDDLVRRHGPLPEARVLHVLCQVCASLAEAHAAGLVHRDVKPANIFLTNRGGQHDFVKVLDFGLAKLASESRDFSITSTNTFAGTPLYSAPEAITDHDRIDARADVYAIGAVGYFLLTGSHVFAGSSASDICLRHVIAAPEPPSARMHRPVSPALEAILLRCLAKTPADRPEDAAELLRQFEDCPVPGRWTSADAARWWADCNREHSAVTQVPAAALGHAAIPAASAGEHCPIAGP